MTGEIIWSGRMKFPWQNVSLLQLLKGIRMEFFLFLKISSFPLSDLPYNLCFREWHTKGFASCPSPSPSPQGSVSVRLCVNPLCV